MIPVYNYMQTSITGKRELTYAARSRSELKKVYENIVNISKRSPYYKINISKENQDYVFGLKELALNLKAELLDMQDSKISNFHSRTVASDDENKVSAFLLSEDTWNFPKQIQIEVENLATPQENKGRELLHESQAFASGTYLFEARVMDQTYSLIFVNEKRRPNIEVMKDLSDYLNHTVPEFKTAVQPADTPNYSYIAIRCEQTGKMEERAFTFLDSPVHDVGVSEFFGLNRVEHAARNAHFSINNNEKQTISNTFCLENILTVELKEETADPCTLRITPDSQKVLAAVEKVISSFNNLIEIANERLKLSKDNYSTSKLILEIKGLAEYHSEELIANGFQMQEDGTLKLEDSLAVMAALDGGLEEFFTRDNGFIARLKDKMEAIAINPMDYLEKIVVFYPNTQKSNYPNPYVTSMYSGLFFNSYC